MDQTPPDESPTEIDDATGALFGDARISGADDAYQVLARKYRPTNFDDMVGQEAMVRTLANAFKTGRIAHAFMLTGVRGVGKTTTARLLARALNYQSADQDAPSIDLSTPGTHCASIMESRHPDVLELDAASRTGVADMRELLDGVRYSPVSARYKVYIIDEVHMLSTAAFNALLKTLEEPPSHVKFIFATTEIRKVPVTVLSRCQRFNLNRLTVEALTAHLQKVCEVEGASVSPDGLALIARAAEGSARDALSILDQAIVQAGGEVGEDQIRDMLGLADRARVLDLLEKALSGDHKGALAETTAQLNEGAEAQTLLKDLLDATAEMARAQALGADYTFAGPADWAARTSKLAAATTPAQAARYWKLLLQGFEDAARAPDPGVAAEMTILRLAAAASLPSPEDAARRLSEGGGATSAPAASAQTLPGIEERDAPTAALPPRAAGTGGQATAIAQPMPVKADAAPGPEYHTLEEICAALRADKEIDLLYEVETYIHPVEIAYGRVCFTPAEGAAVDLPRKLKDWLEENTGVVWEVDQAKGGGPTIAQQRAAAHAATLADAAAHPRVAEALSAFPGAEVVKVDAGLDDAGDDQNVVRVDFSRRPEA
ncbi:MAG: DNA polymerase III subunit gamma/tau [Pseudomonadota bacterium]